MFQVLKVITNNKIKYQKRIQKSSIPGNIYLLPFAVYAKMIHLKIVLPTIQMRIFCKKAFMFTLV